MKENSNKETQFKECPTEGCERRPQEESNATGAIKKTFHTKQNQIPSKKRKSFQDQVNPQDDLDVGRVLKFYNKAQSRKDSRKSGNSTHLDQLEKDRLITPTCYRSTNVDPQQEDILITPTCYRSSNLDPQQEDKLMTPTLYRPLAKKGRRKNDTRISNNEHKDARTNTEERGMIKQGYRKGKLNGRSRKSTTGLLKEVARELTDELNLQRSDSKIFGDRSESWCEKSQSNCRNKSEFLHRRIESKDKSSADSQLKFCKQYQPLEDLPQRKEQGSRKDDPNLLDKQESSEIRCEKDIVVASRPLFTRSENDVGRMKRFALKENKSSREEIIKIHHPLEMSKDAVTKKRPNDTLIKDTLTNNTYKVSTKILSKKNIIESGKTTFSRNPVRSRKSNSLVASLREFKAGNSIKSNKYLPKLGEIHEKDDDISKIKVTHLKVSDKEMGLRHRDKLKGVDDKPVINETKSRFKNFAKKFFKLDAGHMTQEDKYISKEELQKTHIMLSEIEAFCENAKEYGPLRLEIDSEDPIINPGETSQNQEKSSFNALKQRIRTIEPSQLKTVKNLEISKPENKINGTPESQTKTDLNKSSPNNRALCETSTCVIPYSTRLPADISNIQDRLHISTHSPEVRSGERKKIKLSNETMGKVKGIQIQKISKNQFSSPHPKVLGGIPTIVRNLRQSSSTINRRGGKENMKNEKVEKGSIYFRKGMKSKNSNVRISKNDNHSKGSDFVLHDDWPSYIKHSGGTRARLHQSQRVRDNNTFKEGHGKGRDKKSIQFSDNGTSHPRIHNKVNISNPQLIQDPDSKPPGLANVISEEIIVSKPSKIRIQITEFNEHQEQPENMSSESEPLAKSSPINSESREKQQAEKHMPEENFVHKKHTSHGNKRDTFSSELKENSGNQKTLPSSSIKHSNPSLRGRKVIDERKSNKSILKQPLPSNTVVGQVGGDSFSDISNNPDDRSFNQSDEDSSKEFFISKEVSNILIRPSIESINRADINLLREHTFDESSKHEYRNLISSESYQNHFPEFSEETSDHSLSEMVEKENEIPSAQMNVLVENLETPSPMFENDVSLRSGRVDSKLGHSSRPSGTNSTRKDQQSGVETYDILETSNCAIYDKKNPPLY